MHVEFVGNVLKIIHNRFKTIERFLVKDSASFFISATATVQDVIGLILYKLLIEGRRVHIQVCFSWLFSKKACWLLLI